MGSTVTAEKALSLQQLKARWLTPEGQKVLEEVLRLIRSNMKWEDALIGFPGCDEAPNRSDLRGIDFSGESLEDAEFTYAWLDHARFDECYLARANYHGARLHGTSFVRAGMPLASFVQVDATGANFDEAEMVGCKMMSGKFEGASFRGTNLSWVIRTGTSFEKASTDNARTMAMIPALEVEIVGHAAQLKMNTPIRDLELSVRARKCMNKLGITTVGELVQRTNDELLEVKSFGITTLQEVREKLDKMGVKLSGN